MPKRTISEVDGSEENLPTPKRPKLATEHSQVNKPRTKKRLKIQPQILQVEHQLDNRSVQFDKTIPRFDIDDEAGYDYLAEHGYAVFKDVLSPTEICELQDMWWEWLTRLGCGMERGKPETWIDDKYPADPKNGIVDGNGIGQSKMAWTIRTHPKVRKVFSNIWETDELITSFDGGNLFRPWQYNPQYKTKGGWWHVDQNGRPDRPQGQGRKSVQGLVTLMNATEKTGGLCVLDGSLKKHDEMCARVGMEIDEDFVSIPDDDPIFDEFGPGTFVAACAGDLCLWDSRTVHCNTPSPSWDPSRSDDSAWDFVRMVNYVCMVPRERATEEVLVERRKAFEQHVTSTHWPDRLGWKPDEAEEEPKEGIVEHDFELDEVGLALVG